MKAEELIKEYIKEEKQDDVHVLLFIRDDKGCYNYGHIHRDEEFDISKKGSVLIAPLSVNNYGKSKTPK